MQALTPVADVLTRAGVLTHPRRANAIRYGLFALHLYLQSFALPRKPRRILDNHD